MKRIGGMRSDKIGSVYSVIIKAMLEVAKSLRRAMPVTQFFSEVEKRVAQRIPLGQLERGLAYLIRDNVVSMIGTTVRKTRGRRENPLGLVDAVQMLDTFRAVNRRPGGRTAKKTAKKTVRKASGGGRRWKSPPRPTPPAQPRRVPRSYRNAPEERHRVLIFYGTNREKNAEGEYLNTGVPAKLDRGQATILFPKSHKPGDYEDPNKYMILATFAPSMVIQIEDLKRQSKSAFHRSLASQLRQHNDAIFVFVHGFNTSFKQSIMRTAQIALDTNFPGTAVAFSWSSQSHWSKYAGDLQRIGDSSDALGEFLVELREKHPTTTVHLVSHSMGARVSAGAIESHGADIGASEVILQAPDISDVDYPRLAPVIVANCRRVTVYVNRKDKALKSSHVGSGFVRVGARINKAIHANVDAIDSSTSGDGTFWQHNYGFRRPLMSDIREVMENVGQVRAALETRIHAVGPYYVFKKP